MVTDASALPAILQNAPERRVFNEAIDNAASCVMSAATFAETSIVIEARQGAEGLRHLDLSLSKAGIELVAVNGRQTHVARQAYLRLGTEKEGMLRD